MISHKLLLMPLLIDSANLEVYRSLLAWTWENCLLATMTGEAGRKLDDLPSSKVTSLIENVIPHPEISTGGDLYPRPCIS
ncbi:hypothetical protein J6590_105094 [Homalodisca vitripennis]|nr:hypothetical protein J6590_105094 [Homalodisca vitripennis]